MYDCTLVCRQILIKFITVHDATSCMLKHSYGREFPLSNKYEDVVRLVHAHYKGAIYTAVVVYSSTRCLAHDVAH